MSHHLDAANKSKGNFITPKRIEAESEEYSNYSQAPTPVPEYRKKSRMSNKNLKLDPAQKPSKLGIKDKGNDSFRLSKKSKPINKSCITVKDTKAYSSVKIN